MKRGKPRKRETQKMVGESMTAKSSKLLGSCELQLQIDDCPRQNLAY
jgi:hypothetical protein